MSDFCTAIRELSDEQRMKLALIGYLILTPYCGLWVALTAVVKFSTANNYCTEAGGLLINVLLLGNAAFIVFGGALQILGSGKLIQILCLLAPAIYKLLSWGFLFWAIQAFYREKFECTDYMTIWKAWIIVNCVTCFMALFYILFSGLLRCCQVCGCARELCGEIVASFCPRLRKYIILQQRPETKLAGKKLPDREQGGSAVVWSVKPKESVLSEQEMKKIMQHL